MHPFISMLASLILSYVQGLQHVTWLTYPADPHSLETVASVCFSRGQRSSSNVSLCWQA